MKFTIIEGMIAVTILGVLATLAIPRYMEDIERESAHGSPIPAVSRVVPPSPAYDLDSFDSASGTLWLGLSEDSGAGLPIDIYFDQLPDTPAFLDAGVCYMGLIERRDSFGYYRGVRIAIVYPPFAGCNVAGDANASGVCDITDLTWIVSYMFEDGPEPIDRECE